MKARQRIDSLRVVAFTPSPEPRLVQVARLVVKHCSTEYAASLAFTMKSTLKWHGVVVPPETPLRRQKQLNIGKPVIDLTGDDREGA